MSDSGNWDSLFEKLKTTPALVALSEQVYREIEYYNLYRKNWVPPRQSPDGQLCYDAFIVGAGQTGLGIYFGLELEGVRNVGVIDRSVSNTEGTWTNYKRMTTLRTPKMLTGLDYGIPALTFQAFYTACCGEAAWQAMDWVDRQAWADYLRWYRAVLKIPVRNETVLQAIELEGDLLRLSLLSEGREEIVYTQTLILALGFEMNGAEEVPGNLCAHLPKACYAHSSESIEFAQLKGKRVGVLGHAAGAFDAAGEALQHGASEVRVCFRRSELPEVNPLRWFEFSGFLGGFPKLDAETRFQFIRRAKERHQPPTQNSYWRCTQYSNFHMHPSTDWVKAEFKGYCIEVNTTQGVMHYDYLIFGTGKKDMGQLPALMTPFAADIQCFRDVYKASEQEEVAGPPGHFPHMSDHYQYQAKQPGSAAYLQQIFHFNGVAGMRLGPSLTSISGLRYSLPKIVSGVRDQLLLRNVDLLYEDYESFALKELDPTLPIPPNFPNHESS